MISGLHKAFLISRDAARLRTFLVSDMPPQLVQRLLLTPAASVDVALELAMPDLPEGARLGIFPGASSTIPYLK